MTSTLRPSSALRSFDHLFGIATLIAPSILAWLVALSRARRDELTQAVTIVLGPVWVVIIGVLVLRVVMVLGLRRRSPTTGSTEFSLLEHLDVLTRSGRALAWLSSFAIMGAVWIGWASLAAVGLLGTGVLYIVVLLAFAALRDGDPLRGGSVVRSFSPATVTEGDDVVEELAVTDVRIPIGFRLFIAGRVGPRWATTRHVLDAAESGAEIVIESEVGPAFRGEHEAEPLHVWLEDTFGLCRGPKVEVGPAKLSVLPRPRPVEHTKPLMNRGMGPRIARPSARIPTEGCFNLREYQAGDDVRRIHWLRSVAAGELIVRLPDELPPDQPSVRLVLDTFFPEGLAVSCEAPSEMLDLLVAAWLGVAHKLAEQGVRVTLVTAASDPGGALDAVVTKRQAYHHRSSNDALRLGSRIRWQSRISVEDLLTDEATFIVSRGVLMRPPADPKFRWIVVPPTGLSAPRWDVESSARVPFPMGHPENTWSHRRDAIHRCCDARREHEYAMRALSINGASPPPDSFVARPRGSTIYLEAVSR